MEAAQKSMREWRQSLKEQGEQTILVAIAAVIASGLLDRIWDTL